MTFGSSAIATDDHRSAGGRLRGVLLVFAAWSTFTALQLCVSAALSKAGDVHWEREIVVDLTMALYWTAVSFPIAALHRHLRARGAGLGRMILVHLPLLLVVILGDTYTSRWAVELIVGFNPGPAINTITYFADFDTLSYLAIVIVTDALLARRIVHAEEHRASRLESLLSRARLEYLEAQLQPHFLFNALGAVSELAYEAPASALRVLRQLALIFRGALTARPGEVTLGEELTAIEPYLDIQRIRFPDWLRIDYDVGGDTLDCLVPRFVLQPLVENAIRHGLTGRVAAGCIEISAHISGGRLVLRVADNGVGLRHSAARSGYGIGLTNVRERLTTLYGAGDQLRLVDASGGGAVAEVNLPARRIADSVEAHAETTAEELTETSPHEESRPSATVALPRPILQRALLALGLWTLCGILWTVQSYAYLRIRNRLGQYTLFSLGVHDVGAALLWCAIAPLVFAASARFPLTRTGLAARSAAYFAGIAGLALTHAWLLERVFTPKMEFWSPANSNTFILNFLILAVLVGVGHRRQLSEWIRERELTAAALSTELRTARRRAARLQEIPPVVLRALERVIDAVGSSPSPRRTEQLLARLGDYLRVAIECSDEHGITPSREQSLARSLAQFERVARTPGTSIPLTSSSP
ncbi:MAG: sensor histidine kinase [Gemmatimonadaceae bacterium]